MKIAFCGSFPTQFVDPVRAQCSEPCDIVFGDEATVLPDLADVDILVSMHLTQEIADAAPNLKLVQVPGAGLDRIDQKALLPEVQLANAFGHEAGISEYVMGTMIAMSRNLLVIDAKLRRGEWQSQFAMGHEIPPLFPELAGKTLGILGFGHIGQALAQRAKAFDMNICAIRRTVQSSPPEGISFVGGPEHLDQVLEQSDYLVVTLSLSPDTRNLIDRARLQRMKPTAFLINVGRGEIVNEQALYQALSSRQIAGAALDVWYNYPATQGPTLPAMMPFQDLENVIMTPHVSGWTEGMLTARTKVIVENIERLRAGKPLLNAIPQQP